MSDAMTTPDSILCECNDYVEGVFADVCAVCGHHAEYHEQRLHDDVDEVPCWHPKPFVAYVCNKCGYVGDAAQHLRKGEGPGGAFCGYFAIRVPPADESSDLNEESS